MSQKNKAAASRRTPTLPLYNRLALYLAYPFVAVLSVAAGIQNRENRVYLESH
jgi:hypothetical protein